mmetsp:Transcript_25905/g.48309  ORF Transcript_25905/g.48309 Transcript_25905/m.48309 type:complete len:317 (-) Transcript_25905:170-1120(-)
MCVLNVCACMGRDSRACGVAAHARAAFATSSRRLLCVGWEEFDCALHLLRPEVAVAVVESKVEAAGGLDFEFALVLSDLLYVGHGRSLLGPVRRPGDAQRHVVRAELHSPDVLAPSRVGAFFDEGVVASRGHRSVHGQVVILPLLLLPLLLGVPARQFHGALAAVGLGHDLLAHDLESLRIHLRRDDYLLFRSRIDERRDHAEEDGYDPRRVDAEDVPHDLRVVLLVHRRRHLHVRHHVAEGESDAFHVEDDDELGYRLLQGDGALSQELDGLLHPPLVVHVPFLFREGLYELLGGDHPHPCNHYRSVIFIIATNA